MSETQQAPPLSDERRMHIFAAIMRERAYQDRTWGGIDTHGHEVGAWLTRMRKELQETEDAWCNSAGDIYALEELVQLGALVVACMEQHGVFERREVRYPTEPDGSVGRRSPGLGGAYASS